MKNNKKTIIIFFSLIVLIILLSSFLLYKKDNIKFYLFIYKNKITDVKEEKIIYLDRLNIGNITSTGLTYDSFNNSFWIADYDSNLEDNIITPRIIETDSKIENVKSIIYLDSSKGYNIQGISYSKNTNTLWIATGKSILNLSTSGNVLNEYMIDQSLKCDSNGIYYDDDSDELLILCYKKYILKYDNNGVLLSKKKMNLKNQDHIIKKNSNIYITVGANYNGSNYVFVFSSKYKLKKIYRLRKSYAIEGISIFDEKIYIANDGFYHSAKLKSNYIALYSFK